MAIAQKTMHLMAMCLAALLFSAPSTAGPVFSLAPNLVATTLVEGIGPPVETCNIDGTRALILIKTGRVYMYGRGRVQGTPPLLDLGSRPDFLVNGEAGLMSCVATTENVWLYYSTRTTQVVSRFALDGSRIDAGSEVVLLTMENGGLAFHTGSAMHWGNEAKEFIYLARGDGAMCDGNNNAGCAKVQNLTSPYGKILRIDRNGLGLPDNPFFTGNPNTLRSRIWSLGFRNPWSFMLHPTLDNKLLVFDVGRGRREMIKLISRGSQGNWPCLEGTLRQSSGLYSGANPLNLTKCGYLGSPLDSSTMLHEYDHDGQGASIIGGAYFSPTLYQPPYAGKIVYADYVRDWIRFADPSFSEISVLAQATSVTRIKSGPGGEVWVLSLGGGLIQEIRDTRGGSPPSPSPPPPSPTPGSCDVPAGRLAVSEIQGTVYQPLMFASQPEIGWTCVSSSGLPCVRDGRMDGEVVAGRTRPMMVGGRRYARGFGVRGNSTVTVPLDGRCGFLTVTVGLDDSSSGTASMRFGIWRDGVRAFETRSLKRGWRRTLRVSIVGVTTLTLVTTRNASGFHNAVWANPILACGPSSPFIPRISMSPVGSLRFLAEPRQTVQVFANASDYLRENLPRSAFEWQLNIRHCQGDMCHSHPGQRYVRNAVRAWFQLPQHGDCVFYEIQLTVTDKCERKAWGFVTVSVPSKEGVCRGTGVDRRRLDFMDRHNHNLEAGAGEEEEQEIEVN